MKTLVAATCSIALFAVADAQETRWSSYGGSATDLHGLAVSSAGDVDSDSVPDVIVGAPGVDGAGTDVGAVEIRSGASGALITQFAGSATNDRFGTSVANAGDIDNDGISDFLIGAPQNALGKGYSVVISGLTGSTLYVASSGFTGDLFGTSVNGVGDVDLDGFPDLAFGAPGTFNAPGTTEIRSGATGNGIYVFTGSAVGDAFGRSVAGVGDVDLDGRPEIAVGAPGAPWTTSRPGYVRLFNGNGSVRFTVLGATNGDHFGVSVGGRGDVNRDGVPDVVAGADQITDLCNPPGYARVLSGFDGTQLYQWAGAGSGDFFGSSVSIEGDANGDGYDDALVGAPETFLDCIFGPPGYARLFSGRTGSTLYTFVGNTLGGEQVLAGGSFGAAVHLGPDSDGDGRADLLIGGSFEESPSGVHTGRTDLFGGNDLFLDASPKTPYPNTQLALTTSEGIAGNPTALFLIELAGAPTSVLFGGIGTFAANLRRSVTVTVPPGLTGLSARFQAFAQDTQGFLIDTAAETVVLK